MKKPDLSKLPVWARRHIEKLDADLASERAKNAIVDAGQSNTWIETHDPVFGTKTFLPNGSILKFATNGGVIAVYVRCDSKQGNNGELDVNGSRSLIIRPRSSNSIHLDVET